MKWYFCLSSASLDRVDHGWRDLSLVAVRSALAKTTLQPVLIYDGEADDFTSQMTDLGVTLIHYRSPMYSAMVQHAARTRQPAYVAVASGAFLRWTIPLIEKTDDFVLYTDVDVLFRSDPTKLLQSLLPFSEPFLAAGEIIREADDGFRVNMNSGVLLLNVGAFRSELNGLMDAASRDLGFGLDQEWLGRYFAGRWGRLPEVLNFKPYWAPVSNAPAHQPVILHFHGPKPAGVRLMMQGGGGHANIWRELYASNESRYATALAEFEAILGHSAAPQAAPIKLVVDEVIGSGAGLRGWVLNHKPEMPPVRVLLLCDGVPSALIAPDHLRPDVKAAGYWTDMVGFAVSPVCQARGKSVFTARNAYDLQPVSIEHQGWIGTTLQI